MRRRQGKVGTCDFCGKSTEDVERAFAGIEIEGTKLRPLICIECVELAMDVQREITERLDEVRRMGT